MEDASAASPRTVLIALPMHASRLWPASAALMSSAARPGFWASMREASTSLRSH